MKLDEMRARMVNALTTFDRKASTRRGFNPYALGQYLQRVDEIMHDIESLTPPREAILRGFSGRLADLCLQAIGQEKADADDYGKVPSLFYTPGHVDRQAV